jgi:gluconate 2-dehydrogenase gamma chain
MAHVLQGGGRGGAPTMTHTSNDAIDRREALRRAAVLLGGALAAPTVAGVLAGCKARRVPEGVWTPSALTAPQADLVATIAEHILPETDTPGARAVGVHRFIDAMLAESYPAEERKRFVAGLEEISRGAFMHGTPDEQRRMLAGMDREASPFFREIKELTLVGYYTSEVGATRELHHVAVPGRFEGCVPLAQIGRAWAV